MSSLTSASASFYLTLLPVFPIAQKLQGWETDDAFSLSPLNVAQTKMGVDGKFHAGFIYEEYDMDLAILPDGGSILVFDAWTAYQKQIVDIIYATATIAIPAIGKKFLCEQGVLKTTQVMPSAKKILEVQKYKITWGNIQAVAI